ncbi:YggT family protein [bacterium]|nr:MAG: YggT family protein [bacterium]
MSGTAAAIIGLLKVINFGLEVYKWLIIASALLSWVRPDPYAPVVRFIYSVTDPVLYWLRRNLPVVIGGIDLSPLVVIFSIIGVQRYVLTAVALWAERL